MYLTAVLPHTDSRGRRSPLGEILWSRRARGTGAAGERGVGVHLDVRRARDDPTSARAAFLSQRLLHVCCCSSLRRSPHSRRTLLASHKAHSKGSKPSTEVLSHLFSCLVRRLHFNNNNQLEHRHATRSGDANVDLVLGLELAVLVKDVDVPRVVDGNVEPGMAVFFDQARHHVELFLRQLDLLEVPGEHDQRVMENSSFPAVSRQCGEHGGRYNFISQFRHALLTFRFSTG